MARMEDSYIVSSECVRRRACTRTRGLRPSRYLLENMDWLDEEIGEFEDDYLIIDCPGAFIGSNGGFIY